MIAGAVVFKFASAISDGSITGDLIAPMIVGIVTSAIAGWIAVWGTLRLVRTYTFTPFVIYRVALGVVMLVLIWTGARPG